MQCGEQSARTGSYHYYSGFTVNRLILYSGEFILRRLLVNENSKGQVHEYGALACINALFERAHSRNSTHVKTALPGDGLLKHLLIIRELRLYP